MITAILIVVGCVVVALLNMLSYWLHKKAMKYMQQLEEIENRRNR